MRTNVIARTALLPSLLVAVSLRGQRFAPTGSTSLCLTVGTEASISVADNTTRLTGVALTDYTGTTNLRFRISAGSGSGYASITAQVTGDVPPAGEPSRASPPPAGYALSYKCTVTAPGAACKGTQAAKAAGATPVVSFGADARSPNTGDTGAVDWVLADDATYRAEHYTATVTFTISAT